MLVRTYADRDGRRPRAEIFVVPAESEDGSTVRLTLDVCGEVNTHDVHGIDDIQAIELALTLLRTLELSEGLQLAER